ncbi:MAG: DNA-processing protein DprA [Clostridiales bacterium]|nr:DNA-processing protein DprA [Clostridiales bacterium]
MTYTEMEKSWIWLCSIAGVGVATFRKILNYYEGDTIRAIVKLRSDVENIRIDIKTKKNIVERYEGSTPDQYIDIINEANIRVLTLMTDGYPDMLKQIYDPPMVLFCKGDISLLNHSKLLSVVGTRKPTRYGQAACTKVCKGLAKNNVCVVSGMARGIDTVAHKAVLESDAPTIAVLGCSVDIIYPLENKEVYNKILETGLIISEYPPGTRPYPGNFPARNRIVSGLSHGVLVVEAAQKSGTLITIEYAQAQGRDVLAVPGNITSDKSTTPNKIIRDGGAVVLDYSDVLSWFNWPDANNYTGKSVPALQQMTLQEVAVIKVLDLGETQFDEILANVDFTSPQLTALLVTMEIKGIIDRLPGNKYAIKGR